MNFTIPLGVGAACVIISYIAFHSHEADLGFLFLLVAVGIAVLGLVFRHKQK